jgi:hypothetical protein
VGAAAKTEAANAIANFLADMFHRPWPVVEV